MSHLRMFQAGMGAERERMTFGSCPSLSRGPSPPGTSRAAGDLWAPIMAFKPAFPCGRTLLRANQRLAACRANEDRPAHAGVLGEGEFARWRVQSADHHVVQGMAREVEVTP